MTGYCSFHDKTLSTSMNAPLSASLHRTHGCHSCLACMRQQAPNWHLQLRLPYLFTSEVGQLFWPQSLIFGPCWVVLVSAPVSGSVVVTSRLLKVHICRSQYMSILTPLQLCTFAQIVYTMVRQECMTLTWYSVLIEAIDGVTDTRT